MFRRLYWITETTDASGATRATGVYSSIPDLLRKGLPHGVSRLSLVKVDGDNGPFGVWSAPGFDGLESAMAEYVKTDEFSPEQVKDLVSALRAAG